MARKLKVRDVSRRLRKPFRLARGSMKHVKTVVCEIADGVALGRGEAAGLSYEGENQDTIRAEIERARAAIEAGIDRAELQSLLPPGGARNALDCALWDLEARRSGRSVWELTGIEAHPVSTLYTVGLDTPARMQKDAARHRHFSTLKVKVGEGDPLEQVGPVHAGAPGTAIVVDANEAWTRAELERHAGPLGELGVVLIEQPVIRGEDEQLRGFESPVPLCADESCRTRADLERLAGLYAAINIKLDKTGGLTEALALADDASRMGFELMVGNMLGSSLAMAPALVVAQRCRFTDLDGPLLLWLDCRHGLSFDGDSIAPFSPSLWG